MSSAGFLERIEHFYKPKNKQKGVIVYDHTKSSYYETTNFKRVYRIGDITYWGSPKYRLETDMLDPETTLYVNCGLNDSIADNVSEPFKSCPKWLNEDDYALPELNELWLVWPDMKIPHVSPQFWKDLHQKAKKEGFTNIVFFCQGGKGRTGTALASILIANCGDDPHIASNFVRDNYHSKAIEKDCQLMYLIKLNEKLNKDTRDFFIHKDEIHLDDEEDNLKDEEQEIEDTTDWHGIV